VSIERFSSLVDAAFATADDPISGSRRSQLGDFDIDLEGLVEGLADSQGGFDPRDAFDAALGDLFGRE
jgi:hypothetical protein